MKPADAERASPELPAGTVEETGTQSAPTKAATMQAAATQPAKKPLAAKACADWPLPPPISAKGSAPSRSRAKARNESPSLSAGDEKTLAQLQVRCQELGMKIKKNKLLGAGLRLLADAPTGKLLAILGPLESTSTVVRIKKRKAPPRA